MFDSWRSVQDGLRRLVAMLDPAQLPAEDAAELVGVCTQIERLAAAGRMLAARKIAASSVWQRDGHRSAASWLAAQTGTSIGQAAATLETAARLDELPATAAAIKAGSLSEPQAREIASAAAADPATEEQLLEAAATRGLQGLREECRRVRAAAEPDERLRYQAIRRSRYLRSWSEPDGAVRLDGRFTPDDGAALLAAVDARKQQIFQDARRAGQREPYQAYAADALVALARDTSQPNGRSGPRAIIHVTVDHAALKRGHVQAGERCEIPGVGPIPAATARALLEDSILKVLVTDGADIRAVAHVGRTIPAKLRTALEARDPTCVVPGCEIRHGLQIDHAVPFIDGGPTTLWNLRRLCSYHHHLKTHCGYRIQGQPGAWKLITPDDQQGHTAARPPPAA